MLKLIAQTNAQGVLFISGDRHWAELSKMNAPAGYPLYDLTTSALTIPHPRGTPTNNRFRANPTTYHEVNVGHLNIDWDPTDLVLTLRIIDVAGEIRIEQRIRLAELKAALRPPVRAPIPNWPAG